MSVQGLVLDVDHFSTHDGPGIRTAIFVKGCPLHCRWCHSPESQRPKPELLYQKMRCKSCFRCVSACSQRAIVPNDEPDADGIQGISVRRDLCRECYACTKVCFSKALRTGGTLCDAQSLVKKVQANLPFFRNSGGGVTVSGGEPLMQPEFTLEVFSSCHALGIHTALETCGQGSLDALRSIAQVTDLIYFDVKLMDSDKHREYTGLGNEQILRNLTALCEDPQQAEKITVRIPCIPGVNDSGENVAATARFVRSIGVRRMELMPYNAMAGEKYRWIGQGYALDGLQRRSTEYYAALNDVIVQNGVEAVR